MKRHKYSIHKVISLLRKKSSEWDATAVGMIAFESNDPFKILVSTLLSARTQDKTTEEASERLFALADTPGKMLKLKEREIEKAIYPVGFYRTKAKSIPLLCRRLIDHYGGKVPDSVEELITLAGVGRKTANLVVTLAFQKHGICVDTHVHRISNRWGLVKTKTPEETEFALYEVLPKKYWIPFNDLLVTFGQNICRPISPVCSDCPVEVSCPKIGVGKTR